VSHLFYAPSPRLQARAVHGRRGDDDAGRIEQSPERRPPARPSGPPLVVVWTPRSTGAPSPV
jgi:hypothetical protein